jgi:FixJ family two-component response regulator
MGGVGDVGSQAEVKAHVFIVEGDERAREGLAGFLSGKSYAVHSCTDARAFMRVWKPLFPQCVLCALDPQGGGLDVLNWLRGRGQLVPFIGLAGGADLRTVVDAMRLGADNVLAKPVSDGDLLRALQEVWEGSRERRRSRAEELLARLSPREREVLDLVAGGLTSKQIASRLKLSKKTVDIHRGKLLRKLEAGSAVDLARIHAELQGGTNLL